MYIDFQKYNYSLENESDRPEYERRDKEAYKEILRTWLDENIDQFVERKWEVEEIYYLEEISDFIKLLREAENLYELGFYTGCIALIGVSAEDFARYYSIKSGKPEYESKTQNVRLQNLKSDNIISDSVYENLDSIRKIRNDCLHYNQSFKQKPNEDLKTDSLLVLNNLKKVLKELIGTNLTPSVDKFSKIVGELAEFSGDARNFNELIMKQRNAFSHIFNFSTVQHPNIKQQVQWDAFEVKEIDIENMEIDLESIFSKMIVIVDLTEEFVNRITELGVTKTDLIFAQIKSEIDNLGQSGIWHFIDIHKP